MSRIEFEQLSDDVVEVTIPAETPLAMVDALTKSFIAKGLVEDLSKSTLSVRYFYKPEDKANQIADELIKSLSGLTKSDDLPYWHPKAQIANAKRVKAMDQQSRRTAGNAPSITPPSTPAPTGPKAYDNTPAAQGTANGTGRRYAYIGDTNKAEHPEDCNCAKCQEMEKSGYGPKKGGQYTPADNARRKANNTGDIAGQGPNTNVKSFSTKPGQMSGKQQASVAARIQMAANKKQPVKQFTPEQIAAENVKRGLKKSWGQHNPFPSAEEEIMRLARADKTQGGEDALANQLASMMAGKAMLGNAPPAQPTDQEMFGHLVVTEDMQKANEQKWQGAAFNWLAEAAKPISQQFASEAEELEYWSRIKVADRDDGKSGY